VTRHATCGGRVRPHHPRHPKTSPLAGSSVIRSEDPNQRPNHRGRVRPLLPRHLETPVTRHATCGGRVRPHHPRHPKTSPLAGSSVIRSEDPNQRPNHRGRVRPLLPRHLETPVTRHATCGGRVRPHHPRHPKTSPLAGSSVIRSEDPNQRPNHRGRVRPLLPRHLETPVTRHATCGGRVRPHHPRHPKTSPLAGSSVIRSEDPTKDLTTKAV
jgi:transposase